MIKLIIPGIPIAKARPKFSVQGGFARAYTPAKTRNYEELVAWHGKLAFPEPLDGPLFFDLLFVLPIPASTPKKRLQALIDGGHIKKPDLDNLCKSLADGLNGIAYHDDSQIAELRARKVYGDPCVIVEISTIRIPVR